MITPPGNLTKLSPEHYFGVFIFGGTNPTYTLTYNYDGHPGISNESALDLAKRANNATSEWTETNATRDTDANTLTLTGQSGKEYILGTESGDNSLPVELSSFSAECKSGAVVLTWRTESETENLGFIISRKLKVQSGKRSPPIPAKTPWKVTVRLRRDMNISTPIKPSSRVRRIATAWVMWITVGE